MAESTLTSQDSTHEVTKAVTPLPIGVLDSFKAKDFPYTHPRAFLDQNGRAVRATTQTGFLLYGQYKAGYPVKDLQAVFYLYIDNNTYDNAYICTLDVMENGQRVLVNKVMNRLDFPAAKKHVKIVVPFKVGSSKTKYEFRVYYTGYAYLAVEGVMVIDPSKTTVDQLPARIEDSPQSKPFCQGNELLCLDKFDSATVKQKGGILHGGTFDKGTFTPSNQGGIEFLFNLDVGRNYVVEMEIEGNIANVNANEESGGKVALFDMESENSGPYNLQFQRMEAEYRGGGRFRVILGTADTNQSAFLITTADLSGEYSMKNWGNEPHALKIEASGTRCRLTIDKYVSKWVPVPTPLSGAQEVFIMIGNRAQRYSNQHAITRFKRFRVGYV